MSDQTIRGQTENRQITSSETTAVNTTDSAQEQKKRSLKGMLMMALCCAAPLLLVGAVAVFGISLGALASGLVTVAALLACPVGMYLMMRAMNKKETGRGLSLTSRCVRDFNDVSANCE